MISHPPDVVAVSEKAMQSARVGRTAQSTLGCCTYELVGTYPVDHMKFVFVQFDESIEAILFTGPAGHSQLRPLI